MLKSQDQVDFLRFRFRDEIDHWQSQLLYFVFRSIVSSGDSMDHPRLGFDL